MTDRELPREPRDRTGRWILLSIGVIAVLVALEWLDRPTLPRAGTEPPDVRLALLDAAPVDLAALKGQVVLLDFWATWCPPCVESMPVVRQVAQDLEDQGVVAVAVNGDDGDRQEALVRSFLQRNQLDGLQVALDDGSAARAFAVRALPTMVVIGRDGKVAASHLGAVDEPTLRALLEPALAAPWEEEG